MRDGIAGHHPACPTPFPRCRCLALWQADADDAEAETLSYAYGQFYDPNFDADPSAPPDIYGGWNRAHEGEL